MKGYEHRDEMEEGEDEKKGGALEEKGETGWRRREKKIEEKEKGRLMSG